MKIGRNDPCTCGRGKKYKQCCLNWREAWAKGIDNCECEQPIKSVIKGVYDFIIEHDYQGACHLVSAIIYILLKEQGYASVIKLGEVRIGNFVFDHSWVEIDGEVIDISIMNTLEDDIKLPPVVLGKSVATDSSPSYQYGVSPNLDMTAKMVLAQSIGEYVMAGVSHGSLMIMKQISKNAGAEIENVEEIVRKYFDDYRELVVAR